jgi:hypothetical protein
MDKIKQTKADLEKQLEDQLELLEYYADLYDSGKVVAAKPIATAVRVLLHDTRNSHSLLSQLDRKHIEFYDTTGPEKNLLKSDGVRMGRIYGLVGAATNNKFIPLLDEPPPGYKKWVPFNAYWNRVVFVDSKNNSFTRNEIILAVANQDGGAHVDPALDKKYVLLSRNNSLAIKSGHEGNLKPVEGVETAAVRQIGHEKMLTQGAEAVATGFSVTVSPPFAKINKHTKKKKIGRNQLCSCGSGKKYKRCCGA